MTIILFSVVPGIVQDFLFCECFNRWLCICRLLESNLLHPTLGHAVGFRSCTAYQAYQSFNQKIIQENCFGNNFSIFAEINLSILNNFLKFDNVPECAFSNCLDQNRLSHIQYTEPVLLGEHSCDKSNIQELKKMDILSINSKYKYQN